MTTATARAPRVLLECAYRYCQRGEFRAKGKFRRTETSKTRIYCHVDCGTYERNERRKDKERRAKGHAKIILDITSMVL